MNNSIQNTPTSAKRNPSWLWLAIAVIVTCAITIVAFSLLRNDLSTPNSENGTAATSTSNSGSDTSGIGDPNGPSSCTNATCTDNPSSTGQAPVAGTVTAVSNDSITIKDVESGQTITYAITSTTTMLSGPGSSAAAYDSSKISVGDTVGVFVSSDGTKAEKIMLNFEVQSSLTPQ